MHRVRLALLLFCCASCLSLFSQHGEIEKLLKEKKYKEANQLADKELLKTPDDAKLNLLKWRAAYYAKMDTKENFKFLNKAIDLDPTYSEAYSERGNFFLYLLRFEDAKDDIDAAMKYANTDSTRKEARMMLGSYYQSTRNFEGAIKMMLDVLKDDSLYLPALNNLALGYQDMGENEKALDVLYKIEKIDPKVPYSIVNIGFVLSKMEQYQKAIEYFDKAEKLSKNEALVFSNRAFAKYKLNQNSGAMADINKSLKIFSTNSYAYRIRAQIYLAIGNKDKACDDLKEALAYKYTEIYGDEAKELRDKYCIK